MNMEAEILFDSYLPGALQMALDYAGDDGYVASLPQLLHARANASYDNIIWNTWFTSNTEESVVTTPHGNHVVVAVHGGGIYARSARFERMYHANQARSNLEGFTGQYAGKISEIEARDVLEGKLPCGTEIPVYPYDEFKQGIADLPMRYGVILDYDLARKSTQGFQSFDALKDEPNMIVRAGGVESLAAYLDRAQARHNTKVMGNFHPFDYINPDQPQTRVLFLAGNNGGVGSEGDYNYGYDSENGIGGYACMLNMARYAAVVPQNASTSVRDLPFSPSS
ncbi:MAG: hypothetical protein QGG67_17845 [Gammaproteobacteria bacterium]|jgi:hypothetical protein|nr:hypothetical protein [Dehalococcoidales bacterium]MDP6097827.1 hypothetical protein [Gammaproteobacteria bacterium]|tara:strand:+ start:2371 stop:3213 length:843 start_codon:yes stop_codon:yes gene_type:complete